MRRSPVTLISNTLIPAALAAQFTAPTGVAPALGQPAANTWTVSAAAFNNTSASGVTVTVHVVPAGVAPSAATQIGTTLNVPAAGAAPTQMPALIAQNLLPGWSIQMLASTANVVSVLVSGYLTEL